jgi:hypothetical protein
MTPTLRQADIDRETDRDPAAGLAEYYAEFRTDISAFVSQEVIDGCVARGVFEFRRAQRQNEETRSRSLATTSGPSLCLTSNEPR